MYLKSTPVDHVLLHINHKQKHLVLIYMYCTYLVHEDYNDG